LKCAGREGEDNYVRTSEKLCTRSIIRAKVGRNILLIINRRITIWFGLSGVRTAL